MDNKYSVKQKLFILDTKEVKIKFTYYSNELFKNFVAEKVITLKKKLPIFVLVLFYKDNFILHSSICKK